MLADLTVKDFLDKVAGNDPVPGGGSIAALGGALASALATMVTRLTIGKKGYEASEEVMQHAQTPWVAAKTDDPEKEEAIVAFMKYITSEESVKQLTLEGAVFLSPKLNMEDPDVKNTEGLLGEYLALNSVVEGSTVNIQRNLTTTANTKLPSLLESLALDSVTPDEFIEQLSKENQ